MGATLNVAKPTKGSTVAVFGLGTVGLAVSEKLLFSLFLSIQIRISHRVNIMYWSYLFFIVLNNRLLKVLELLVLQELLVLI